MPGPRSGTFMTREAIKLKINPICWETWFSSQLEHEEFSKSLTLSIISFSFSLTSSLSAGLTYRQFSWDLWWCTGAIWFGPTATIEGQTGVGGFSWARGDSQGTGPQQQERNCWPDILVRCFFVCVFFRGGRPKGKDRVNVVWVYTVCTYVRETLAV